MGGKNFQMLKAAESIQANHVYGELPSKILSVPSQRARNCLVRVQLFSGLDVRSLPLLTTI